MLKLNFNLKFINICYFICYLFLLELLFSDLEMRKGSNSFYKKL